MVRPCCPVVAVRPGVLQQPLHHDPRAGLQPAGGPARRGVADGLDQRDRHHPGRHLPGQRAGRAAGRPRRTAAGRRPALRRWARSSRSAACGSTPSSATIMPAPEAINWELRTVIVVILDFLVPATVLGMVGPVVAKMAVEQVEADRQRHRRRLLLRGDRLDRRDLPRRLHPHVPWPRPRRSCW